MFHPWRELRKKPEITVNWTELNYTNGITDGHSTIWLDSRLLQVERRCVLAHEMIHIERGHTECQKTAAEIGVRVEAARRLIAMEDLLRCKRWARSVWELADELWVTPEVLADRIAYLTVAESAELDSTDEDASA
jgi:hypothetical protein